MLSKLVVNKGQDWDTFLEPLLFAYQTTPYSSTGESPFFLLYGRDAKLPTALDFYPPCPKTPVIYFEYGKTFFKELKLIRDIARKNIQQAQSSQKKQHNKASRPVSIEVGCIATIYIKFTINPYHYILKVLYPPLLPCHCPHVTVTEYKQ